MTIKINGTNTTAQPSITGTDTDTGLVYGTDEVKIVTGGTDRVTVNSTGNLSIAAGNIVMASGNGIDFSATANSSGSMTSELLDDYEEGTWTPELRDAGGDAATTTTSVGTYTKIGRMCHLQCRMTSTNVTGLTGTDSIYIHGLPYTIKNVTPNTIYIGVADIASLNIPDGSNTIGVVVFANASASDQSYVRLFQVIDNGSHTSIKVSAITSTTNDIFFQLSVPVA